MSPKSKSMRAFLITIALFVMFFALGLGFPGVEWLKTVIAFAIFGPTFVLSKLGLNTCLDATELPQKLNCTGFGLILAFGVYWLAAYFSIGLIEKFRNK